MSDLGSARVLRSLVFLGTGAVLGIALAGYGLFTAKGTRTHIFPPEAVALVNQRQVLRSDFMTQIQTEFGVPFAETTAAQRNKVLEDMINEELTVQRGLEIDLPSYDPDVRSALVAGVELEVTADVLAQQPTMEELEQYYQAHKEKYSSEGVMQLRDLVVKSGANVKEALAAAKEAVSSMRGGASVSEAMARFGLKDSGKLMDGHHVDTDEIFQFAVRAKLGNTLFDAVLALQGGQISEPVPDADGVHVIVMVAHRFPVMQDFDQARDRVWKDFIRDAQAKVVNANIQFLRSRADIVLAPEYAQ